MRSMQKQIASIAALLREQTTMSLATTGEDGMPCIAPLFYVADDGLSLYWLSSPASLHSLNLGKNPRAAATVYAPVSNWREIRGVQISGLARAIAAPALREPLIAAYFTRFKLGRVLRLAVRQSVLFGLAPDFLRYIDNARGFGSKFELTRGPEGWRLTRPSI